MPAQTDAHRDRYDVQLTTDSEPIAIYVHDALREEKRVIHIDRADQCTLMATSTSGEDFHVERVHAVWHSTDGGATYRFWEATLSGHAVNDRMRIAILHTQSLTHGPAWLPSLLTFVKP